MITTQNNTDGRSKEQIAYIKRNNIVIIPGASNYGVNSKGTVFNVKRMIPLKACSNGWAGYQQVSVIYDDGRRVCKTVHRLVWTTLNGNIPHGYEIGHIDGHKKHNALSNLELTTRKKNTRDPRRVASMRKSIKNGTSLKSRYAAKVKNPMCEFDREKHRVISKRYWEERRKRDYEASNGCDTYETK